MGKEETFSRWYSHHPGPVVDVLRDAAGEFNDTYGCRIQEVGVRGRWIWKKYVYEGQGVRLESTVKDAHDNVLTIKVDSEKHPSLVEFLKNSKMTGSPFEVYAHTSQAAHIA